MAKVRNALRIVALDAQAEGRGIGLGTSLADARGAVPDLCVMEADEAADRALLETLADWADRYTPLVALDPPRGLFLDITGCAHLHARKGEGLGEADGEAALLRDCLHRLARQGFEAQGAIAATAGAAWAIARYGAGGLVPSGCEAAAIAALPVAALRIDAETEALLDHLGLKRIGQLVGRPRKSLAARFGPLLLTRLDQALGRLDEVLSPRRPAPHFSAERRFAEPVVSAAALLQTIASLARSLALALERHGLGARLLELAFFRTDGAVVRTAVGTAEPVREAKEVAALFSERLAAQESEWDAGFGFDLVRLAALSTEPLSAAQIDLAGEADDSAGLAHLYDRLEARLGGGRVRRFEPLDTHIPERAVRVRPLVLGGQTAPAAAWRQEPEAAGETPPDRPLRLFPRPEQVEVLAEVPEGAPLRFRWRRVIYEVAHAEGPERIAPEWWRAEDSGRLTRDYFRVEDLDGRRYWLFREGLYGRETAKTLWYLHGLFA